VKILFVCSRNRLRSSTAEVVFSEVEVLSAGLDHDAPAFSRCSDGLDLRTHSPGTLCLTDEGNEVATDEEERLIEKPRKVEVLSLHVPGERVAAPNGSLGLLDQSPALPCVGTTSRCRIRGPGPSSSPCSAATTSSLPSRPAADHGEEKLEAAPRGKRGELTFE
jgi:hypothetical protein